MWFILKKFTDDGVDSFEVTAGPYREEATACDAAREAAHAVGNEILVVKTKLRFKREVRVSVSEEEV